MSSFDGVVELELPELCVPLPEELLVLGDPLFPDELLLLETPLPLPPDVDPLELL